MFLSLLFYGLSYMALVAGQFSVNIKADFNYDTNTKPKTLCENIDLQPSNSAGTTIVRIDSNFENPSLGCLGGLYDPYLWACVTPGINVTYTKFCSQSDHKILPDASTLYSLVERNQTLPIQKTSFNISFINSTTTISRRFNVIFNLTDLTRWIPIMGNYGGGVGIRDCNSSQHIQIFTHKETEFWNNMVFHRLNFQCSDGGQYYNPPPPLSSGFGSDIAANCTNTFGMNGMTAYIGSSGSPIGGRFYCGVDYNTSVFGSNQAPKNRTYYCKPGSLVTGTRSYAGAVVDGFGLACSPINLTVALMNVNLSSDGTLTLTPANFQIKKNVGNINYLKLNITFPNISQASYQIRVNNVIASQILYGDIIAFGAIITFDPAVLQGEYTISVGFDTGLQYSVVATSNLTVFTTNITTTTTPNANNFTFASSTSATLSTMNSAVTTTIGPSFLNSSTISQASSAVASLKSTVSDQSLEQQQSPMLIILIVVSAVTTIAVGVGMFMWYRARSKKSNFRMNTSRNDFQVGHLSSANLVPIKSASGSYYHRDPLHPMQMVNSPSSRKHEGFAPMSRFSTSDSTTHQLTTNVTTVPLCLPGYNILRLGADFIVPESAGRLGMGGTASIFVGTLVNPYLAERLGFKSVAVKVFPLQSGQNESFLYEVAIMNLIPLNPNTVRFVGYMEAPQPAIVMKQYEGSLYGLFQSNTIHPDLAFKAAKDIASGLQLIHSLNIMHLDVKPQNMLWERLSDGSLNFCICDFGFASLVGDSRHIVSGLNVPKSVGVSVRYTAPEVFVYLSLADKSGRVNSDLSKKIDVYAYGLSMYTMLHGGLFWKDLVLEEIMGKVLAGARPSISALPPGTQQNPRSRILIEIVERCWAQNSLERPSFVEICEILSNH